MQEFTVVEVGILHEAMQMYLRHRDPDQVGPEEDKRTWQLADRIAKLYSNHLAGPVDAVALVEVKIDER